MAIKKIVVRNFKSFKNIEVELGEFNVLIGGNASGKSNFVQAFAFLRDMANHRLDNAIQMQGGIEYLRNINIDASEDLAIAVISDQKFRRFARKKIIIEIVESNYDLALKFGKPYSLKETLELKCEFIRSESQKTKKKEKEKLGEGKITFSRSNGNIKVDFNKSPDIPLTKEDFSPALLWSEEVPLNMLLVALPFVPPSMRTAFRGISVYDLDPKLPKKATPITGKADLEEDGSNLAIVLKNIIENEDEKRKLSNLVRDMLPFVDDLDVEKFADKSFLFTLKEKYCKNQYVPASLISDGTINITALIVALYFQEKLLTIIEEPERNLHPYLISKVVSMMKDAAKKKQIIITTHNPEVIKHAGPENILFVSRDKECFSRIQRLSEREEIKRFLENEIGVEELFVQDLLGV